MKKPQTMQTEQAERPQRDAAPRPAAGGSLPAVLIVFLGLGGGCLLVLNNMGTYLSAARSLGISAGLLTVMGLLALLASPAWIFSLPGRILKLWFNWRLVLILSFLVAKMYFDYQSNWVVEGRQALAILIQDIVVAAWVFLVWMALARRNLESRIYAVEIAFLAYVSLNVGAYYLGIQAASSEVYESITGKVSGRMLVPFGAGVNNFGCMVAFAMGLSLILVPFLWQRRRPLASLVAGLFALFCAFICLQVEIRSAVLALLYPPVYFLLNKKLRRLSVVAAVLGLILLPFIVYFDSTVNEVVNQVLRKATSVQRTSSDLASFSGRFDVWRDGLDQLAAGNVEWCGVGIAERDTRSASPSVANFKVRTTYHNGALDALVVYGPVVGGLAVLGILLISLWGVFHFHDEGRELSVNELCIFALACLCLTGYLEAITATTLFWALFALISVTLYENAVAQSIEAKSTKEESQP